MSSLKADGSAICRLKEVKLEAKFWNDSGALVSFPITAMDWTRKSSAMGSPAVFTEALPLEVVVENAVDAKDPPNVPAILEPTIIAATAAADPSIISKAEAALATTTGSKSEGGADGNTEGAAVVFF
jgi:hypothetical protein